MKELLTILIAEDDYQLRGMMEEALIEGGFKPEILSSAEEAATLLKSGIFEFRALVTDVNLLGAMDGWELAKRVREADPTLPVVYTTGGASDEWSVHGVPGSVLLEKPFTPAQLLTAISQLLNVSKPPGPEPA